MATARTVAAVSPAAPSLLQSAASGLPFMLGAAGDGVATGEYERLLGRQLDLTATWADSTWSSTHLPVLQPGGELAGWTRALDVAVGAFGAGTTWAQAASGACDELWTASLRALAAVRGSAPGTTFIRFAHEMNGNWYPWSVRAAEVGDFQRAWQRYRALQRTLFPSAQLVFSLNHNTVGLDADSSVLHPGPGQLDVLGVGYYNRYPYLATAEDFARWLPAHDRWGGPAGLDAFRDLAGRWGVPLALPEWSVCADSSGGDSPAFVTSLRAWLGTHAGAGPGQVLYACQFNVSSGFGGAFTLLPSGRLPASSAEFRRSFGG
ncbi:hypothetical protein SAMN06264364_10142 [Quadrisphaera granulorum]|uniref:GH26 domain-containing protein n=1 Tax=Quadrisphaera granulorum TaxID=317664 RepID=A0A316AFN6_9ACTN|nr:hypothetical protein BXY45_10142 [Quadrisphaera granulorum]SZE94702.1 hypothetical protein SAMN06264364_10142 [Quadrisphaera granulorum]